MLHFLRFRLSYSPIAYWSPISSISLSDGRFLFKIMSGKWHFEMDDWITLSACLLFLCSSNTGRRIRFVYSRRSALVRDSVITKNANPGKGPTLFCKIYPLSISPQKWQLKLSILILRFMTCLSVCRSHHPLHIQEDSHSQKIHAQFISVVRTIHRVSDRLLEQYTTVTKHRFEHLCIHNFVHFTDEVESVTMNRLYLTSNLSVTPSWAINNSDWINGGSQWRLFSGKTYLVGWSEN
jgi:hypothetical protein